MTALPYTGQNLTSAARTATDSASVITRSLMFAMGASLPIISLSRYQGITKTLASRVEPVDIFCLFAVIAVVLGRRLRVPAALAIYIVALTLALGLGLLGSESPTSTVTAFAALAMAALYFTVGASIASSPKLVRALILGIACGAMFESVIVIHDFLLPGDRWFRARAEMRVRGTFRSTAQLGNYGFSVAGILLSFGWVFFRRWPARLFVLSAGLCSATFVFASSRRAGMFAIFAWIAAYLILGLRQVSRRSYMTVLVITLVGLSALSIRLSAAASTNIGARILDAAADISSGQSFTQQQFEASLNHFGLWFPFGVGTGEDYRVGSFGGQTFEIHNGHLALIVELGVLGLVAFYWLCLRVLLRKWQESFGSLTPAVRLATITFLLSSAVFMIHARQHRDRGYMLFLGLAPTVACAAADSRRRLPVVMLLRRPKPAS